MTYVPIPAGTQNWDVPVNAAFTDQDTRISVNTASVAANTASIAALRASGGMPMDFVLQNWSFDPAIAAASVVPTSGTINMSKMWINAGSVSALGVIVSAPGVTLTAGQNLMGLYDQGGNLIGQTADQSASWVTAGYKQIALTSLANIPSSGFYYVAYMSNGATPAALTRGANNSATAANLNLTADQARFATGPTGQTSLPASVTMSARTPTSQTYWMAVA